MRRFQVYRLLLWLLGLALVAAHVGYGAQFWGWRPLWAAIHQFGHVAGWVGAAAMLLSLSYLPRKKKWFTWGSVRNWYHFHVVMGLVGPLLIILHAYGKYFGLGGLTLAAVFLVLVTGVIGHFLYKRLPEEIALRQEERERLLAAWSKARAEIESLAASQVELSADLDRAGPLGELAQAGQKRPPRATLGKKPGSLSALWRSSRDQGRRIRSLRRRVKSLAAAERRAAGLRERHLVQLLGLERDTRNLLVQNELFSLWRRIHVPLSWLMWWLVALHLFAWVYY